MLDLESGHGYWIHAYCGIERNQKKSADIREIHFKKRYWNRVEELLPHENTDDVGEEARLRKIFPEKIITNENKEWGRDSCGGMRDAIIDWLCLLKCEVILGLCSSVFSSFGARYGDKKLILSE